MGAVKRVYVAAPFKRWRQAANAADILRYAGMECSSRWIRAAMEKHGIDLEDNAHDAAEIFSNNTEDISESDAYLGLVWPWKGCGMWGEASEAHGFGLPLHFAPGCGPLDRWHRPLIVRAYGTVHRSVECAIQELEATL
jgi:hypothetical protein